MEGWKTWRKRILAALGAAGLMVLGTPALRAEMVHGAGSMGTGAEKLEDHFVLARNARTPTRADGKALLAGLRQEWEAIREDLSRSMLETTLTMFFIRGGHPPAPPNDQIQSTTPPSQCGPPPPPPPPPPTGGGEDPPGNTGNPPPQGTPEPASIVTALLGAGLASMYSWRKRRRNQGKPEKRS